MKNKKESRLKPALKKKRPTGEKAQLRAFFETLFGRTHGYIEVKAIRAGLIKRYFYPISDLKRLTSDLTSGLPEFKNFNLFFGTCPRKERKGKEEDISEIACVWIDLDCHNDKERIEKLKKLKRFNLRPSIIVSSGRGYHVYWLLDRVYPIEDKKERLRIKGYVKGLSETLGGDHTFDLARILRIPGTMNLKDPKNPLPVKLSEFYPDRKITLENLDPYWTEVEGTTESDVTLGEIPDRFWSRVEQNAKIKATWEGKRKDLKDQSRSGYDMALANLLVSCGFSDDEVASILRKFPTGRGKDATLRYLNRTIGEARRAWGKRQEKSMKNEEKEKWINDKMKALAKEAFATERKTAKKEAKIKEETKTIVPGFIHLVKDDNTVKYLLKDRNSLKIVEKVKTDKAIWTPKQNIPIQYASKDILNLKMEDLNWKDLLNEVILFIKSYVEMPSESDYLYLGLWVFHTYLIEKFNVTPLLYFYGVHVTGKTRAGEVLNRIGFKVERLTAPTEATLFRSADRLKNTLVIDEIKLWGKDANQEVSNLIKSRYKRGLSVSRINLNKEGEDQIEYFDVFAPMVICTTEPLPDIIESRCLSYTMRANIKPAVEDDIDEEWAQTLRNKLTMFRFNYLDKEFEKHPRIARRRLNEILFPLYQLLMLIDPKREDEFKTTIKEIERQKAEEAGMSLEAEIIEAVTQYQREEKESFVLTKEISAILNQDRAKRSEITDTLTGNRLRKLGFHKGREKRSGRKGFEINPDLLKKLQIQYGLEEWGLTSEEQKQKEFEYSQEEKDNPDIW